MNAAGHFAIILAAGKSGRMGREKARLPWLGGKSLLRWTVDAVTTAGWQPLVVLNPENFPSWQAELPAGCATLNPDPARGKTSSLAAGAARVPAAAQWILLTAVDQPRPPALYLRLRLETETNPAQILVPDRQGGRGHPVVLPGALRDALLALDESAAGLRGLLDAHLASTRRVPTADPAALHWDLNTPEIYDDALAFFRHHYGP